MPYVARAGTRIHYEVEGTGRPLVLVHGLSLDLTVWTHAGYVDDLARDHLLLLIDMPGHGLSDRAKEDQGADADARTVAELLSVTDAVGVDQFAIWGWSAGGWMGWIAANTAPHRVRALITTGNADPRPETSDEPWEEFDGWIRQPVAKEGMSVVIDRSEEWDHAPVPEWFKDILLRADPDVFLSATTRDDWRRGIMDLATFEVPTLLMAGEFEDEEGQAHEVAGLLPRAEAHVLPGVGHIGAFLRADLAIPVARKFLDHQFPWP